MFAVKRPALMTLAVACCIATPRAYGAYESFFEEPSVPKKIAITLEYEVDNLAPTPVVQNPFFEIYTLRLEKTFTLAKGCRLATRQDIPFASTNYPSRDNPYGDYEFGFSELLSQGILEFTVTKRWSLLAGLRMIWPTETQDQFGCGRIQAVPILGIDCALPEISKGSSFTPLVRYAVDVGGYGGRTHINEFQIRPMLNIELPKGWTVTLYPSGDIRINMADHGKLFLPFDGMVSKAFTKHLTGYVEIGVPIVKDYRLYDFKLVTGLSLSF